MRSAKVSGYYYGVGIALMVLVTIALYYSTSRIGKPPAGNAPRPGMEGVEILLPALPEEMHEAPVP